MTICILRLPSSRARSIVTVLFTGTTPLFFWKYDKKVRMLKMHMILISLLIAKIHATNTNKFIIDYFSYKQPTSIVGITCNSDRDNLLLMRYFSQFGIATIFTNFTTDLKINVLVRAQYRKIGVIIDARCYDAQDILLLLTAAALERQYNEMHYWLVITSEMKNFSFVYDDNFDLSTDFAVATSQPEEFVLYDLYNVNKHRGTKLNVTLLGKWNYNSSRMSLSLTENKYRRRSHLHGMIWRVAYFTSKYKRPDDLLEEHLQDYQKTGTKDGLPKFGYSVVNHLAEMYNATILLRQYGIWKKGDRSGPLTRALEQDEIDMTGTLISVIPEKLTIIKFVYPAWPFRTCFMFRSPQPRHIRLRGVLGPFESTIWHLMIVIITLYAACLTLTLPKSKVAIIRYSNALLLVVGCLAQQCTAMDLDSFSTRMAYLSMMIFSLVIYDYYSASVVSVRLNGTIIKMPDSLVALANSKLQLASEPMIYLDFLIKDHGKEADFFNETRWWHIPEESRIMLPDKAMQLVRDGGLAYHTHPDVGYPYINRMFDNQETCELTEVHLGKKVLRSIAVTYNSTFTEITKTGFAWMSEVGIRQRQLMRWTSRKPRCRNDILSASSVTIYEFAPQLILLLLGLWCALVVCIGEILVERYPAISRLMSTKSIYPSGTRPVRG